MNSISFLGKTIHLAIFDLDGTLFESTSLWADIDKRFFAKRGLAVPKGYAAKITHLGLKEAATFTKAEYGFEETEEEIIAEWNAMSAKAYEEEIPAKPFAKKLLEAFASRGVHLALATANSPSLYVPALKRLGLYEYFAFMADPLRCKGGKSDSKMYDECAKHFSCQKENTLVFEDSLRPMRHAYEASYQVVGVYDKNSIKSVEECRGLCLYFAFSLKEILGIIERENPII